MFTGVKVGMKQYTLSLPIQLPHPFHLKIDSWQSLLRLLSHAQPMLVFSKRNTTTKPAGQPYHDDACALSLFLSLS